MKRFSARVRSAITLFLFIILTLGTATPAASQTAVTKVIVTSVNANGSFPDVLVQARALDANGAFIPGLTADAFGIAEDGQALPIQDVTSQLLPVSVNVVFVIDELSITSRLGTVRGAIQSFAENQMRPGDTVEVLAADSQGRTQTIVPLTSDPAQVVEGMLEANYNPSADSYTRLLKAVQQAMRDLSSSSGNIGGVNTIIVFSVSMIEQTDLNETIEEARLLAIPIHTVLLGTEDVLGALNRLARETRAGNAIFPDDLNDLFDTLNAQRNQDQYLISYRSQANQAGDHELVVGIDDAASAVIPFTLDKLEPPQVRITAPSSGTTITRTETELNQKTETVQPTEQTVAVEVGWPDGHPREVVLEKTVLVVNGESLGPATTIRDNGEDPVILEFTWDLQEERTPGATSLPVIVEVEDELGLKGTSEPLPVRLDYITFATGVGAAACPGLISQNIPQLCSNWNLIVPLVSLVVAIAALFIVRRNPRVQQQFKQGLHRTMGTIIPGRQATIIVEPLGVAKASLLVLAGHSGTSKMEFGIHGTTTIGRSVDYAQLVLQSDRENSPISRLHCTLLEHDGRFEIRDEASPNGTYVNGIRLVKAELRPLKDGDTVEIAQVQHGGVKLKFQLILRPGYTRTQIVVPNVAGTDGEHHPSSDTPTKVIDK